MRIIQCTIELVATTIAYMVNADGAGAATSTGDGAANTPAMNGRATRTMLESIVKIGRRG